MKQLLACGLATVASLLLLPEPAPGHGGTYRGPGDTVPPGGGSGGGGGPVTPGPGGAGAPGPAGPGSGPITPGAPPTGPGTGPRMTPLTPSSSAGVDLTHWEFWWGFNKDPYLQLRARIHGHSARTGTDTWFLGRGQQDEREAGLAPSVEDKQRVTEALLAALEREGDSSNDVLTGALIALAKIGESVDVDGEHSLVPVFKAYLGHSNLEVAETAALALGILASEAAVPTLLDLVHNTHAGRALVGGSEVPYRTRSFATFGLGLVGARTNSAEVRSQLVRELVRVLESPSFSTRDLKVAAMSALGQIRLDSLGPFEGELDLSDPDTVARSLETQVAYLTRWLDPRFEREDRAVHHWHARAHAPTALARLLRDAPNAIAEPVERTLIAAVTPRSGVHDAVRMSCAHALGYLLDCDDDEVDVWGRKTLIEAAKKADQQSRRFALIALGLAGTRGGDGEGAWSGLDGIQRALTASVGKGRMHPWSGLGMGVHGYGLRQGNGDGLAELQRVLRFEAVKERSPDDAGAFLIALGLTKDPEAYDVLLERLDFFKGSSGARGYAAVGLGLLGDAKAVQPLQAILADSRYDAPLLRQCAVALGLLGDKSVVASLVDELSRSRSLATQAALASALGAIGDRSALEPLLDLLQDERLTQTARGFAAVALGSVCDKDLMLWNSAYSVGVNYRASTETLTGGGTGILDIL